MPVRIPVLGRPLSSLRAVMFRAASALALIALASCGGADGGGDGGGIVTPEPPKTVSDVSLSGDSLFFGGIGLSRGLTATGRASDGSLVSSATFTWSSSAPAVATVSATGSVTAVGEGEATITARSGSGSASAKAVVVSVAKEVRVTPATLVLDSLAAVGAFTATVVDSGGTAMATQPVVGWFSSSSDVAPVSATGGVEARGVGTATISAATEAGGLVGSAQVTVEIQGVAAVVGSEGGTVAVAGGVATLRIPDGALDRSVALTATAEDEAGVVQGTGLVLGPDVTFAEPVELEVHYQESALGAGESELAVGLYRKDGGSWTPVDGIVVDEERNVVTGLIRSTGRFALRSGWMRDPSGLWLAEETTVADGCFDEVGNVETTRVFAELKGDQLTVEREGETVSGTLVGGEFGWDLTYASEDYPGVDVREIYAIRIDRSGETATGKGRLIASGGASCEIRTTVQARRISSERPQADDIGALRFNVITPLGSFKPGGIVKLQVEAFDPSGLRRPVEGAFVDLMYTQPMVIEGEGDPGRPQRVQTFTTFELRGGLVGTTQIQAVAFNEKGEQIFSEVLPITVSRDPTEIRVLAPKELELQSGPLLVNGSFFDVAPVIAWQDDDPTAVRWELVTPWGSRFRLRPRRGGCAVGARCADQIADFWKGAPDDIEAVGSTRIEGFNVLDQKVSQATFTQTQAVRSQVTFGGTGVGVGWTASGFGGEVPAAVFGSRFPNGSSFSCGDKEQCLHGRLYPNFGGSPSTSIAIEGWTDDYLSMDRVLITIPESFWNLVAPWGQGTGVGTTWNCDRNALPPQDQQISISVGYTAAGTRRGFATRNGRFLSDPENLQCEGSALVEIDEYTDLRGTWRRFKVTGSGGFVTNPSGTPEVVNAGFSFTGIVKWAPGELDGVRFWAPEPGDGR